MSDNPRQAHTGLALCVLLLLAGLAVFSKAGLTLNQMDFTAPRVGAAAGAPAPLFTLEALSGPPVGLQSLHGQVVLINFWATWCGPCKLEMPHIQALHEQYRHQGLRVLAVSTDHIEGKVAPFIERQGFTFPVLFADGTIEAAYQVRGIPSLFLIDRQGAIRYRQVGFNPAVVPHLRQQVVQLLAAAPKQPTDF